MVSPSFLVSIRVLRVIRGFLLLGLRRRPRQVSAVTSFPRPGKVRRDEQDGQDVYPVDPVIRSPRFPMLGKSGGGGFQWLEEFTTGVTEPAGGHGGRQNEEGRRERREPRMSTDGTDAAGDGRMLTTGHTDPTEGSGLRCLCARCAPWSHLFGFPAVNLI